MEDILVLLEILIDFFFPHIHVFVSQQHANTTTSNQGLEEYQSKLRTSHNFYSQFGFQGFNPNNVMFRLQTSQITCLAAIRMAFKKEQILF